MYKYTYTFSGKSSSRVPTTKFPKLSRSSTEFSLCVNFPSRREEHEARGASRDGGRVHAGSTAENGSPSVDDRRGREEAVEERFSLAFLANKSHGTVFYLAIAQNFARHLPTIYYRQLAN